MVLLGDYTRETWANNSTVLNATRLNNMESGLDAVTDAVRSLNFDVSGSDTLFVNGATELMRMTSAGLLKVGSGDNPPYGGTTAMGVKAHIAHGDFGSEATTGPTFKVVRLSKVPPTSATGFDDGFQNAAICGAAKGTTATYTQTTGILGYAENSGTAFNDGIAPNNIGLVPDACGLAAEGHIKTGGVGRALGIFAAARVGSSASTAGGQGVEASVQNSTGSDHIYEVSGGSRTMGIWVNQGGSANDVGGAIQVGANFGAGKFKVGLSFSNQNPVKDASFRDDGNAANSILINGTHASGAILTASGTGHVIFGGTTRLHASSSFEVQSSGNADPYIVFGSSASNHALGIALKNSNGGGQWIVANGANSFATGTIAGDGAFLQRTTGKKLHLGGTAVVVSVGQDNTLGFHNVTPVSKRTGWAAPTGTATRTTYDTTTVTTQQLAERVKGLIDDLTSYGLIGT